MLLKFNEFDAKYFLEFRRFNDWKPDENNMLDNAYHFTEEDKKYLHTNDEFIKHYFEKSTKGKIIENPFEWVQKISSEEDFDRYFARQTLKNMIQANELLKIERKYFYKNIEDVPGSFYYCFDNFLGVKDDMEIYKKK